MRITSWLNILSNAINIVIFVYFILALLKIKALDYLGLIISAFGILSGLASSIITSFDRSI